MSLLLNMFLEINNTFRSVYKAMEDSTPEELTPRHVAMQRVLDSHNFDGRQAQVLQMMEALTGESFNKITKDIPQPMRKAGIILALKEAMDVMPVGSVGLVWTDGARGLRMAGVRDLPASIFHVDKVRPATDEEILTYLKKDLPYIKENLQRFVSGISLELPEAL
jgi:hypothetical protein